MKENRTSEEIDIYITHSSLIWLEKEAWWSLQMLEESYQNELIHKTMNIMIYEYMIWE